MHNYFYILLASIVLLQVNSNIIVANKIDGAINLINEELIVSSISEKSKLDAYNYNDLSFLAINHEYLMKLVDLTLSKNLANIDYQVYYYFYDSQSKLYCPIGYYNCNSVQMKLHFTYQHKIYEEILRYEPVSI